MSLLFPALAARILSTLATRGRGDDGQSTAEYALVLLGAAAIAMLLVTWATKTGKISEIFDWVVGQVMGRAK